MEMIGLKSRSPRSLRTITAVRGASPFETPPSSPSLQQQQPSRAVRWTRTRTRIRVVLPFLGVLVAVSLLHSLFENSILSSVDLATSSDKKGHPTNSRPSRDPPTSSPSLPPVMTKHATAHANATTVPAVQENIIIMNNQSHAFVDRWCDVRNTKWYIETTRNNNLPQFLIPGAKYAGTRELAQWLVSMAPSTFQPPRTSHELSFFLDGPFSKFVYKNTEKTAVYAARQRLAALYSPPSSLNNNNTIIPFDASPGYLFYSSLVPRRILCVLPWIKLIVLLQDPMDRLYTQYQAAVQQYKWKGTMEEWIQRDYDHLQSSGLLTAGAKRVDIDMSWYHYAHETVGEGGGIGRSLYYLQLRHWFQAMQAAGKNPADDVLIVWTDEWKKDSLREWERIRKFFHLADSATTTTRAAESIPKLLLQQESDFSTLSNATVEKLRKLFDTSNTSLRRLLRQYGVDAGRP